MTSAATAPGPALAATVRPQPRIAGPVLVTGANGFIGRALTLRLRELGVPVRGVDLRGDESLGIVTGDTAEPAAWASELAGATAVVHTAALVSNVAPRATAWAVNVQATHRMLTAAAVAGVPRFVHLSSIAAFGFDFPDGVSEDYPPQVTGDTYVDTKVNGEAVVLAAHAAGVIDCTILRPGDVYGPGSRPWVLIPLQLIRSHQAVLPDGGRGVFSPVHIDNLVDGILLALSPDTAAGRVYTITDGTAVTCREYFSRLADMVGGRIHYLPAAVATPLAVAVGAVVRRAGRDSELSAASMRMLRRRGTYSIERARAELGYRPLVDLDHGMAGLRAWLIAEGLAEARPR